MMESMTNPMAAMPGFEAMKAQQKAFMKAMTGGFEPGTNEDAAEPAEAQSDLDDIRAQLAAMQEQLSKMGKK